MYRRVATVWDGNPLRTPAASQKLPSPKWPRWSSFATRRLQQRTDCDTAADTATSGGPDFVSRSKEAAEGHATFRRKTMKRDKKNVDDFIRRNLPWASREEVDEA